MAKYINLLFSISKFIIPLPPFKFVCVVSISSSSSFIVDNSFLFGISSGESGLSCGESGLSCGESGLSCGESGLSCGESGLSCGESGLSCGESGLSCGESGLSSCSCSCSCSSSGSGSGSTTYCGESGLSSCSCSSSGSGSGSTTSCGESGLSSCSCSSSGSGSDLVLSFTIFCGESGLSSVSEILLIFSDLSDLIFLKIILAFGISFFFCIFIIKSFIFCIVIGFVSPNKFLNTLLFSYNLKYSSLISITLSL